MSQAATTMALANNSFEEVAALLTGAGEILGDNKLDEIGNGLKTVTLRLQNQAGKLKELGEEYDDLQSVSKTQQQIYEWTKGQVNIMQDADPTSFKSTYEILKEVSQVIDDLTETEKANLIQLMFGKNRANVGTAVLKAFQSGQIDAAYEAAMESAGSAQAEFDKWSESVEAHINSFKAAFEGLANTIIKSDFLKDMIDQGTRLIEIIDRDADLLRPVLTLVSELAKLLTGLVDKIGAIGTALTTGAILKASKGTGRLKMSSLTNEYARCSLVVTRNEFKLIA